MYAGGTQIRLRAESRSGPRASHALEPICSICGGDLNPKPHSHVPTCRSPSVPSPPGDHPVSLHRPGGFVLALEGHEGTVFLWGCVLLSSLWNDFKLHQDLGRCSRRTCRIQGLLPEVSGAALLLLPFKARWEGRALTRVCLRTLVPPPKNIFRKVGQTLQLRVEPCRMACGCPWQSLSYLWKTELGSPPSAFRTKFILQFAKKTGNWGVLADFPYGFISNCEVCSAWNISAAISLSYARLMISITHAPEWWIFSEPGCMKDFKRGISDI